MLIALWGIAGIPAISDAALPYGGAKVHVTVTPPSGSTTTRFAVSFRATGQTVGWLSSSYRVTASRRATGRCKASAAAAAPAVTGGVMVRVALTPGKGSVWCAGTYQGQVWAVQTIHCPPENACPQIEILPRMIGTFAYRVTRGH